MIPSLMSSLLTELSSLFATSKPLKSLFRAQDPWCTVWASYGAHKCINVLTRLRLSCEHFTLSSVTRSLWVLLLSNSTLFCKIELLQKVIHCNWCEKKSVTRTDDNLKNEELYLHPSKDLSWLKVWVNSYTPKKQPYLWNLMSDFQEAAISLKFNEQSVANRVVNRLVPVWVHGGPKTGAVKEKI